MDSDNVISQYVQGQIRVRVCRDVSKFVQAQTAFSQKLYSKFRKALGQSSLKYHMCASPIKKASEKAEFLSAQQCATLNSYLFRLLNRVSGGGRWVATSNPRAIRDIKQRIIGLQNELKKAAPSISKKSETLEPIDEKSFREKYFIVPDCQDGSDLDILAKASERASL